MLTLLQKGRGQEEGSWEKVGGQGRRSSSQGNTITNRWIVTGGSRKWKRGIYCPKIGCRILNSSLDQDN